MSPRTQSPRGTPAEVDSDPGGDDAVWRSLGDRSRRRMLDLLRQGPMTTGSLNSHFDFSRFAVMKHLAVLERGGLIVVERRGRERINHLNPVPIQSIYRRWIRPFEKLNADRLLRLKEAVEAKTETTP